MDLTEIKQSAIKAMGFDRLNSMQEKMLDSCQSEQNILLLSPTGSGKTLAFLLPVIAKLRNNEKVLILVPSRELAIQINEVFRNLKFGYKSVCCYGGHDIKKEIESIATSTINDPILVIGTTGRIKDHIERGTLNVGNFSCLVLDEYDKSLEFGFEEELKFIVSQLTSLNFRVLTSATHAFPIANWLNFKNYLQLNYLIENKCAENSKYEINNNLEIYQVKSPINDKLNTLKDLLCSINDSQQIIIFSNYRESSERISHYLSENGIENSLYHGGLEQDLREKALARFRGNSIRILVSTDLASRGLDIPEVSHIIHYHLPTDEEAFTHRNGRTARAGASGSAYLIIGPNEFIPIYFIKEPKYFRLLSNRKFINSPYVTIYIGRGKKSKISKGDVLGFFTKNAGIPGTKIGRIDIYENCSYCSIDREIANEVIEKVKGLKIKGEKTHYLIVRGS